MTEDTPGALQPFSYRRAFHTTAVCGGVAQKTPARRLGVLHPSMRVLQPKGGSDLSGHDAVLHAKDRLYSVDGMEPRN